MRRPVVGIALAWLGGALYAMTEGQLWLITISLLWLLLIWTHPQVLRLSRHYGLLILSIALLSAAYNVWYDQRNVTHLAATLDETVITLYGTIVSPLKVDGDQASFVLRTAESERMQVFIRLHSQAEQKTAEQWQRGDRLHLLGTLQKPRPARNFDTFEYARYLYYQKIHWILQVDGLQNAVMERTTLPVWMSMMRWIDQIRQKLGRTIDQLFSPSSSGFMQSVLIGFRDDLLPEQFQHFALIGLTHIMAISGLHVGIFVTCCIWAGNMLRLTRETNALVVMGLIPCYMLLTGAAPSAVRAGCMAMVAMYAWRRGWLKDGLSVISIVGTLMLIVKPYYLHDISFQLSFIVTIGLIVFVPKLYHMIPLRSPYIKGLLAVTTAAAICSFPLSIYYFNQFSLLSWLANLLLVPVISTIVIPLGMLTLLLALMSKALAYWPAQVIEYINSHLFTVIEWLSEVQSAQTIWASPSLWWILAYYSLITMLIILLARRYHLLTFRVLGVSITLGLLLLGGYHPQLLSRDGLVQFIDVGQGDATLIRTPQGKIILIDGGGTQVYEKPGDEWKRRVDPYEVGKDLLVPLLKKRGIHQIDYLIVTHADLDHYGGLQAVINHIPVRAFVFNGTLKDNDQYEQLLQSILSQSIPVYQAHADKEIAIDAHTQLSFLHPQHSPLFQHVPKQNDLSLVTLLQLYDYRILLTGDIELRAEREMIWRAVEPMPAIDVMQVAHHGSRTSTSDEWLAHWQPQIAIIPVGRNNWYGHPHPHVLKRLAEHHIAVYRTDWHGEIQFRVSDTGWLIRTKLDPP